MTKETKNKPTFEQTQVLVKITSTSNKTSEDYETKVDTKTVYFTTTNKADIKKLENFGLTLYTAKELDENENEVNFFMCKLSEKAKLFVREVGKEVSFDLNTTFDKPNFSVDECLINIVKGKNKGQTFKRINAILVNKNDDIVIAEAENPFSDIMEDVNPFKA